jgi:hypothetical protein
MKENWEYITLKLSGSYYTFIYDASEDRVYTEHFPGVDVEPFTLACGTRLQPLALKKIIKNKINEMKLEMQLALEKEGFTQ